MNFVVTAGHGGRDPGNTWGGMSEAELMTDLRNIVALKLRQQGHIVTEDKRDGQRNLPLAAALALIKSGTVSIELHTNASTNLNAEGVEVIAPATKKELAQKLAAAIAKVLEIPVRRKAGWFPLTDFKSERGFSAGFARRGGLIIETFFQSNNEELTKYLDRKWLVGSAIAATLNELAHD